MKKQDLLTGELLSALMDGQVVGEDRAKALSALLADSVAQKQWHAHHVVGDTLRSTELAPGQGNLEFLERLQQRLAREEALQTSTAPTEEMPMHKSAIRAAAHSANTGRIYRRRGVQGLAFGVCAVVAVMFWTGTVETTAPLVQSGPALSAAMDAEPQVVLRDPELDALLAAHRAAGGNSALQLPSGFLRNATFERPNR